MNGANDREEIRQFLDEQFGAIEESGAIAIVGMVHHAHSGPVDLHSMKVGHGKWGNAEAMAHVFDSMAQRHARGINGGGAQQYEIAICRGNDGRPTALLPFVRVGSPNIMGSNGSLATEPPTEMGLRQQAQRWGEQLTQSTFTMNQHLLHSQQAAIDSRDRKIGEMEKTNADLWIACKGLLLELDKKRHEDRMGELTAARIAEFQKQAMALAPAILNMMAGKEVFPLSAADTSLIDGIASWATPEDVRGITAMLATKPGGEKLSAILMDRYDAYYRRKAAEAEAEKRLMRDLPNRTYEEAERDAAGEAIKALRGTGTVGGPEPKALNGHTNSHSNGHVVEQATSHVIVEAAATSADTGLLTDLVERVPAGQLDMLVGVLGGSDPEFARRLKERLEVLKKDKGGPPRE
jgi:hypothetical protein